MVFLKKILPPIAIFISVLMSLGGAVNSGVSYFFMAIPFMAYVLYRAHRYNRTTLTFAVIFVLFCIGISLTRDSNPLLYPVLDGGVVTMEEDVLYVEMVGIYGQTEGGLYYPDYYLTGSGKSDLSETGIQQYRVFLNDRTAQILEHPDSARGASLKPTKLTKIKNGTTYPITGIYHDNGDFADRIRVVTEELGMMHTYGKPDDGEVFSLNKPVQSAWSYRLGILMYWPALPTLLSAYLKTLLR